MEHDDQSLKFEVLRIHSLVKYIKLVRPRRYLIFPCLHNKTDNHKCPYQRNEMRAAQNEVYPDKQHT